MNPYSRSGIALKKVKGVVIHYVANPGSTAKENRDYFNNLQNTHTTKASSHYIVGLDGEIIQCIPQNEISYASNEEIEEFNSRMKNEVANVKYLDLYSYLKKNGYRTTDGTHYDNETTWKIYRYLMSFVS